MAARNQPRGIEYLKLYPTTTISERWAKGKNGDDDLYAAYHPKIDTYTGLGDTHEAARSDLLKNRYKQYLWGLCHDVIGAGLWK